jgi:signal transduction histidine kinase
MRALLKVNRWADLPLRTKGAAILALPLVLLAAAAVASVIVTDQQTSYQDAGRATLGASDDAGQILASLLDAETGVRGYVATADPVFLAPWNMAASALGPQLHALAQIRGSEARTLDATAQAEMAQLRSLVTAERTTPLTRPRLNAALLTSKARMDRLRAIVGAIQSRLQSQLAGRRSRLDARRSDALAIAVAGLVIGLLGVVIMFLFIRRVARRVDEVRDNAHRLGIGESLAAPTSTAHDEIGRLAAELRQASELLASRSTDLVAADRSALAASRGKDRFLSHLGHELRTPLTAIVGFGQLLSTSDHLHPEDADNIAQIVGATNHLMAIIDQVDGSAPTEATLSLTLAPTELADIGGQVCALMGPIAAERRVLMALEVPSDTIVMANRQRLTQVMINLVSNAIKYNRPGGHVRIHCLRMASGRLRVQVTDTGLGIRGELLPRVFAPFERLDAADGDVEGSGIGLALSRTYVEAMGGAVGVDSVEGQGATFWVDLALAHAAEATRESA